MTTPGGPGSIAEQEVDHGVAVLLGGGRQRFQQPIAGGPDADKTVIESAQRQGYTVVNTGQELAAVSPGQKVLGLFSQGNMALEWEGLSAVVGGTPPQRCQEDQRPADPPSLADMTTKALELLDQSRGARGKGRAEGQPGFFLQVEGASIDKQDHAANPCGQIGENVAFDRAVKVALGYAATHPDTLVVVTAATDTRARSSRLMTRAAPA